jgi:hypothetical protein
VPPLQQPAEHVVASHEQVPFVVSHTPFAQDVQTAPPVPHCDDDSDEYATQVAPLQQPFGHEVESQTHWPVVLLHSWPDPHAPHVAPPVPQEPFDSTEYASHVPLEVQQPAGHDVASQTHLPAELHSWPEGHAAHVAPLLPHEALDSPDSCSHTPRPVQQPAHAPPLHEHVPFEHESPLPHALQAAPPAPHWELDCEP